MEDEHEDDGQRKYLAKECMKQQALVRAIEFEVVNQKEKGLSPHKVVVTRADKIDGACEGKEYTWDSAMKSLALQILDMAMVKVTNQNLVNMVKLRKEMDNEFEYFRHDLSDAGFRDCVRWFMKGEHA
ncbi:unnamed protein product [Sphagnum jensenii]|uniref:Uncharacterized protein n=1 Tax=Sphagnum jensenii TaxID=128206 RepID=A0ABP1B3Q8_9BRYO